MPTPRSVMKDKRYSLHFSYRRHWFQDFIHESQNIFLTATLLARLQSRMTKGFWTIFMVASSLISWLHSIITKGFEEPSAFLNYHLLRLHSIITKGFEDPPAFLVFFSLCLEQILLMKARTIFWWSSFGGNFSRGMKFSKKATIDHRRFSGTGCFIPFIYQK